MILLMLLSPVGAFLSLLLFLGPVEALVTLLLLLFIQPPEEVSLGNLLLLLQQLVLQHPLLVLDVIYWVNVSKRGGKSLGAALPAHGKPRPSSLFYSDYHSISNSFPYWPS